MKTLLVVFSLLFITANSHAASNLDDRISLGSCGGEAELRSSRNGDVHLKLVKVQDCSNLYVSDGYGNQIKKYKLTKGGNAPYTRSYTFSKKMLSSACNKGDVQFKLSSNKGSHKDNFYATLDRWTCAVQERKGRIEPRPYEPPPVEIVIPIPSTGTGDGS